jgi:hypothetical protein
MKRNLLNVIFIMSCFAGLRTHAQDIFYSKEQKFTLQNADFNVVGWSGDRLYTYRASKEGYYLDAFNDSMRLLATVALDFFPKKIYETQFVANDNGIIVLYQAVQNNRVVQYAARLDNRARMMQKPIALDSVKMGWMAESKQYYSSAISPDKSKIMIYRVSSRKNKRITLNTILFDNNLKVLANGNPFIDGNNDLVVDQALLSNDGTLYLGASPDDNYKRFSNDAWVFKLSTNGQQFNVFPLPLAGKFMSKMYLRINDVTNDLYLAAFYASGKTDNMEGVVYGVLSAADTAFSIFKQIPFDDDLRNSADSRNKKKAFDDFDVRKLIVKNDGGFILVAEDYLITTRTYGYGSGLGYYNYYNTGGYNNTTVREYHYGDVMILNYDKDGNRKWQNFIRKDQNSQDDAGLFSSFALLNSGASLVFLYNDYTSSKSTLSLAAVDIDGNLQMKRMNTGRMTNADWLPRSAKQTDSRELLVPVLRKDNISFARVAF